MVKQFTGLKLLQGEFYIFKPLLILLVLSSVLTLPGCGGGEDADSSFKAPVVRVFQAQKLSQYELVQSYVGEVEAARKSRVGFEVGGMISSVSVDEGDSVSKGEILAELDTERLKARRSELAASRDQSKADLELAQITRQRTKEALDLNAVSSQDYDVADKDYQAKIASLRRAESAVDSIDVDLSKSKMKAPYDSYVTKRYLDEGEVIPSGQAVLEIIERTGPEVRVGIAGSAASGMAAGEVYSVKVLDKDYKARVKSVLPQRSESTRTVDVILTLDADSEELRDGELAALNLDKTVQKEGYWLPISSLTESSRGLWSCYVAVPLTEEEKKSDATHRLDRRELELIHQESDRVYVQGTLNDNDLVVRDGLQRLVPGQLVRLESPDAVSGGAD